MSTTETTTDPLAEHGPRVVAFLRERGTPATVKEVATSLELADDFTRGLLKDMREQGQLAYGPRRGRARTYDLPAEVKAQDEVVIDPTLDHVPPAPEPNATVTPPSEGSNPFDEITPEALGDEPAPEPEAPEPPAEQPSPAPTPPPEEESKKPKPQPAKTERRGTSTVVARARDDEIFRQVQAAGQTGATTAELAEAMGIHHGLAYISLWRMSKQDRVEMLRDGSRHPRWVVKESPAEEG